jgi:hypothetical protein
MQKRLAIQLFGHLRSFRKTYKSLLKNIVEVNKQDGYEIDIFIHTWTETDHSDVTWNNPDGEKRGVGITESIKSEIYTYYNPKKLLIEKQLVTDDFMVYGKVRKELKYKILLNLAYTAFKSSEIRNGYEKETGIRYDYVIVTRPDIIFHKPMSIDKFLSIYEKYTMEMPKNALFVPYLFHNEEYISNDNVVQDKRFLIEADLFFWGPSNIVDKAVNVYTKINNKNSPYLKDFYCNSFLWYRNWIDEQIDPVKIVYNEKNHFDILRTQKMTHIRVKGILRFIKHVIRLILPYGLTRCYQIIRRRR